MRSKMIFFLALVMGIITTVLFLNYTKQFESKEVDGPPMVQVVKTKEKIAENQQITSEMLEVVTVPEENIHPQAVKDIAEVTGKYSSAALAKGEILLRQRVKDQEDEKLLVSRKITEGYRAVSVAVANVQAVANLIRPEDHVDVVVTTKNEKDEFKSEQVFSDVRVLAVGKAMTTKPSEGVPEEMYDAVTLELKPEDAVKLINATEKDGKRASVPGNIHFTLHPSVIPPGEQE